MIPPRQSQARPSSQLLSVRSLDEMRAYLPLSFSRKWNQRTGQPAHSLHGQGVDSVEDNFEHQVSDRGANVGLHAYLHTQKHTCAVIGL